MYLYGVCVSSFHLYCHCLLVQLMPCNEPRVLCSRELYFVNVILCMCILGAGGVWARDYLLYSRGKSYQPLVEVINTDNAHQ